MGCLEGTRVAAWMLLSSSSSKAAALFRMVTRWQCSPAAPPGSSPGRNGAEHSHLRVYRRPLSVLAKDLGLLWGVGPRRRLIGGKTCWHTVMSLPYPKQSISHEIELGEQAAWEMPSAAWRTTLMP